MTSKSLIPGITIILLTNVIAALLYYSTVAAGDVSNNQAVTSVFNCESDEDCIADKENGFVQKIDDKKVHMKKLMSVPYFSFGSASPIFRGKK